MKQLFLLAALTGSVCFTAKAIPFTECRGRIAANIRRCRNCGGKYDLSELSYTAKSWKMFYCCENCARKSGALK
ncbi:MAG: hypothetical protein MJ016_03560 [Victivallaceae bacterium]|nr:hypothetical protein [Victivallaceae bacterium]